MERIVAERLLAHAGGFPTSQEKMPVLWSLCELSIVPLRDTPVFGTVIPSKIFESVGMGAILISLPDGEATAIVRDCGAGICVQPEDPVAMANAIADLADDKDQLEMLGQCAREAAPRYSRGRLADEMLDVLVATASQ